MGAAVTIDALGQELKPFDVQAVRKDFPILSEKVHGKTLVYLDNAASSQKPKAVLDALMHVYQHYYANIHRGVYQFSEQSTAAYEAARAKAQRFLGARFSKEIIFVRGATEAINLVAHSFAQSRLGPGDEILISALEHHANLVPWQRVRDKTGCELRVIPIHDNGELDLEAFDRLLGPRTRLLAISQVSNALGTINPVGELIQKAKAFDAAVLIDGAQAVPHLAVDVQALGCDFYAFSGHKVYGPSGIGVLWGKAKWLEQMEPYQLGGDMIRSVSFETTTYNDIPHKFEAGTPAIADAIALGAALDYVSSIGLSAISAHEHDLLQHASELLGSIPGCRLIGTAKQKAAVVSFELEGIHPHDIGTLLDREGIAIRTGHHCCQPLMDRLGVPATARASFAFYNTHQEVEALGRGLVRVREVFG